MINGGGLDRERSATRMQTLWKEQAKLADRKARNQARDDEARYAPRSAIPGPLPDKAVPIAR